MTTNPTHDMTNELNRERDYLATVRAALAAMLDLARHRVASGDVIAGDGYTAEVLGRMLRGTAKDLADEPTGPPFFGRLSFGDDPAAGEHRNQRYYLGRRHVVNDRGLPLVIDWRAPVSRSFYQATPQDSHGVTTRRRYGWTTSTHALAHLTGFEDEHVASARGELDPSGLVARELDRPRVGPMRDIVATIQPDQDHLVRADLDTSLCIQGGPGTGKTAVGLHRAAYLLYTHRRRLTHNRILIIGPSPTFLRYISAVMPALGEVNVDQRTLDDLIGGYPVRAIDTPAAEQVKHDPRMADVLRRAVFDRITADDPPAIVVPDGSSRLRLSSDTISAMVCKIRKEQLPYHLGRERLRTRIVDQLCRQAEYRGQSPGATWTNRVGRSRPVTATLEHAWPTVRPAEFLASLYRDPDHLAKAASGILSDDEQALVRWAQPPRSAKAARWSAADLVLIDEIAGLVDHPEQYGHIIIDEAQDLSPMQCRVLARRSNHCSITVLGDLAQGTTPWAPRDWAEQLAHLGHPDATHAPLTFGFRVPTPVLTVANQLLTALDVAVPATRAVRNQGHLTVHATADPIASAIDLARSVRDTDGSTAVIAADESTNRIARAFTAAGLVTTADDEAPALTILPASLVKGMEYDTVILVEPADIVNAEPRGLNRLYVVLTRAVAHLHIVHKNPLPEAIAADAASGGESSVGPPSSPDRLSFPRP